VAFTSVLTRAISTYNTIASELNCHYIPVHKHWRLNERHYGALQGLNKSETAAKHGEEQVLVWRRSYDIPPPELTLDDERHPKFDQRYSGLPLDVLPKTESLKLTVDRVLPYWYDAICPAVLQDKKVVVVAHGNSLRAIVKHLSGMGEKEIIKYNIPTACPLVYEFDANLKPIKNYYLLDEKTLKERMAAVANQGKAK
jgi:2,3-bisphosphoglycerate-dependent phosphoglycerate mutase